MKLYGSYTSPYVRHCRIVIDQLGLKCDFIEADYAMSAEKSPSMKVPILEDADLHLTDSTSILLHFYNKSGKPFISSSEDMDVYAMINTVLDTAINLFLLENDDLTPESSNYLTRQASRIEKGLDALENSSILTADENNIGATRLICFLDWALFRNRISLDGRPKLQAFVDRMNTSAVIKKTAPAA